MFKFLKRKYTYFKKDTPVLIADNSNQFYLRNAIPAYAIAALPIVAPVPIQDVNLFDYAVAHKSVTSTELSVKNASYGLTANTDDTYIIGTWAERRRSQDPYTSDQQRSRDQYEINETDWNEVAFEEVNGSSTCKLALHNDWIEQNNYSVDAIVNMNLPEQGISGPFKITSIRHIIPQKKPVDEDENDEWEYRPVTGLFTHHSDAVHTITFSNNETLGVTAPHPIFSTTYNDWRLAGELEVGEKVLTYHGESTVLSNEKKVGSEAVYNLEIKDLHNFLVGEVGVVVHNTCFPLSKVVSWAWQKGKTFGHTFTTHGKNEYNSLIGRISSGSPMQGHWLDNQKAANFMESIKGEIEIMEEGTSKVFSGLPSGVGQVLSKNASGEVIKTASTKVMIVRGSETAQAFIKTAYPFIE